MSCHRYRKQLDDLVLGLAPSGDDAAELATHVRSCADCARRYQRVMLVMRQLSPTPHDVAPEELAHVAALVLGPKEAPPRPRRKARLIAGVALAAGLALSAALLLPLVLPGPDAGQVTPRGSGVPIDAALRAYCLRDEGPLGLRVLAESSGEPGQLSCARTGLLQFAYVLREDEPAFLYLAGIDESGAVLPYVPRGADEPSVRLDPAQAEVALRGSVRLNVRHQPGRVRVVGLVTRTPLAPADASRLLTEHSEAFPELRRLELIVDIGP